MPMIQLPACPAYVSVLGEDASGHMVERATLMTDASALADLLSPRPNPAQERAVLTARHLLGLSGTVRLGPSSAPAPVIAYA